MGKSTTANMLDHLGVPVHDSDAEVHRLLDHDREARIAIGAQFPYFRYFGIYGRKDKNGVRTIDRKKLGKLVFKKPQERKKLESILHPLVQKAQQEFLRIQKNAGRDLAVLDIPLLFETGADQRVDYTITVSAPSFIQRERVILRPNMDEKKFQNILKTQMPDAEKCARADYVLPTGLGRSHTMKELKKILFDICGRENIMISQCDNEANQKQL